MPVLRLTEPPYRAEAVHSRGLSETLVQLFEPARSSRGASLRRNTLRAESWVQLLGTRCARTAVLAARGVQLRFRGRLRNRSPGPEMPFSSMNITPAASRARRRARSFDRVNEVSSSASSARLTVFSPRLASRARSSAVHLNAARAARICELLKGLSLGAIDPTWQSWYV